MFSIIGAGMAGLAAAAILRDECRAVYEKQAELPNNHSAVLRFRSEDLSHALNIPFKRVRAIRAVHPYLNPIAEALAYSRKTNGAVHLRSISTVGGETSERFIAPSDFIERMSEMSRDKIELGWPVGPELIESERAKGRAIISTIPMNVLMDLLGWISESEFRWVSGTNITATVRGADAYCSLYVPSPDFPGARISLTGDRMVVECYSGTGWSEGAIASKAAELMGLSSWDIEDVKMKEQKYGKILPIKEEERKRFILWATEKHYIYSLGRFATWRPGLLLDDIVQDVRVIQRLQKDSGSAYRFKKG